MKSPKEISNQSSIKSLLRNYSKQQRRVVKDGYPRTDPFKTLDEIERYLNQEEIDCLICGERKKSLSFHLAKIHRISTDDYKSKYGLPLRKGLTSKSTTAKLAEVRYSDTSAVKTQRIANLRSKKILAQAAASIKRQRVSGAKTLACHANLKSTTKTPKKYTRQDAESVIIAMEQTGVMLYPYLASKEGIKPTAFKALLKENPDLSERYKKIAGVARKSALSRRMKENNPSVIEREC